MYSLLMLAEALITRLRHDERGATAVEYGLIILLVATVIVVGARVLGHQVSNAFTAIAGDF